FLTDGRYTERARREAPGVEQATYERSYLEELGRRFAGDGTRRLGVEAGAMTLAARSKLEEAVPDIQTVPVDDVVEAGRMVKDDAGYADAFVHGTGHGVGLQIHEAPWLGKGRDEPVPGGTVVTVEPGIYVPGLGGVRIEDMVEVTEDGGRVVGAATRELIEL